MTATPSHPHTERPVVYRDTQGRLHAGITIEIAVPSRVAAMLPERDGFHGIPAAGIGEERMIPQRARNWSNRQRISRTAPAVRPLVDFLAEAIAEGCDTIIQIDATPHEWHLVGRLCGKLDITPGQWFLACATYNAEIEERAIERQLAGMVFTA